MFTIQDDGAVRRLTIDNPERRNAIPGDRWAELGQAFRDFEDSPQRALIVTGAGEDFCSGADLAGSFTGLDAVAGMMRELSKVVLGLYELTKPTLAVVDGVAVGAGMNLALGCDLAIASSRARFSEIFVQRGLTVDFGGTWLLPRRVGLARAKELSLTGRIVGAADALEYGLVSEVVAPEDLARRGAELAAELAAGAPIAQRFIKEGLNRSFEMSFAEAVAFEEQAQVACFGTEDVIEGVSAFLQKRPPEFKGR